jgi:hypothetical protein
VLALKAGHGVVHVLQELLNTDDIKTNVLPETLSNAQFVIRLYQLLLGRNPDGRGFADYVSQLDRNSLSRGQLQQALLGSSEFRSRQSMLFPRG